MDPIVARVRELAIEEIDRQEDVDRVLDSGPWPALIWEEDLWVPRTLSRFSPFPWDPLRETALRAFVRDHPSGTSPEERVDSFRRLASAREVFAAQYERLAARACRPSGLRRAVLVDVDGGRAETDRSGLFGSEGGRKVLSLTPDRAARRVWDEVASVVAERREAREAAEFMRRAGLARWRKERCAELSVRLQSDGLTCPRCRTSSRSHQLVTSFFICGSCGCSFRPEELPGEIPPA